MQSVAAWLVARPHNAVLALAGTLLLPPLHFVSGAVVVLLVLRSGARATLLLGAVAGLLLVAAAFVTEASVQQVTISVILTLLPTILFAVMLARVRSLTLALQVLVVLAVIALLALAVAIEDPVAFWQPMMDIAEAFAREVGWQMQADFIATQPEMAARVFGLGAVIWRWMLYVVYLVLGYGLYRKLPSPTENFGRFCDLNFGRTIAAVFAIVSVVAFASGAQLLQDMSIVLFFVFWVQGLAIVHWMHESGQLHSAVLAGVYAVLLVLYIIPVVVLAVAGYMDAWFRYRRQAEKLQK